MLGALMGSGGLGRVRQWDFGLKQMALVCVWVWVEGNRLKAIRLGLRWLKGIRLKGMI